MKQNRAATGSHMKCLKMDILVNSLVSSTWGGPCGALTGNTPRVIPH